MASNNSVMEKDILKRLVADLRSCISDVEAENSRLHTENKRLSALLTGIEERLQYEMRRAAKALDVADNASQAVGSIARMTHSMSMIMDTLEMKLDRENKMRSKLPQNER